MAVTDTLAKISRGYTQADVQPLSRAEINEMASHLGISLFEANGRTPREIADVIKDISARLGKPINTDYRP
jgi:hypothetical protein